MLDCSPIAIPMSLKDTPYFSDNHLVNPTKYQALIRSLQYLTFTRSGITHSMKIKVSWKK